MLASLIRPQAQLFRDADNDNYATVQVIPDRRDGSELFERAAFGLGSAKRLVMSDGVMEVWSADGTFSALPAQLRALRPFERQDKEHTDGKAEVRGEGVWISA